MLRQQKPISWHKHVVPMCRYCKDARLELGRNKLQFKCKHSDCTDENSYSDACSEQDWIVCPLRLKAGGL